MARSQRKYGYEYKVQAVKLAREISGAKAAKELGVPEGTIHTWLKAARSGSRDKPWKYQNLADAMREINAEDTCNDTYLYVYGIFDCFDSAVLGLAMEINMKATLCQNTVKNAYMAYPEIRGAILHSDRGT